MRKLLQRLLGPVKLDDHTDACGSNALGTCESLGFDEHARKRCLRIRAHRLPRTGRDSRHHFQWPCQVVAGMPCHDTRPRAILADAMPCQSGFTQVDSAICVTQPGFQDQSQTTWDCARGGVGVAVMLSSHEAPGAVPRACCPATRLPSLLLHSAGNGTG
jgi:hypothetical protein